MDFGDTGPGREERQVEIVDHQVEHHVHVDPSIHGGRQPVRLDELGSVKVWKGRGHGGIVALDVADGEGHARLSRRLKLPLSLLRPLGDRLFHKHLNPAAQGFDREVGVGGSGRGDGDQVDGVEERLQRFERSHAQIARGPLAGRGIGIVRPDHLNFRDPLPGSRVVASEVSDPDHPDAQQAHRTMPRSELRTNSTNSWTSG